LIDLSRGTSRPELVRRFTDHGQRIRTSAACGSIQGQIVARLRVRLAVLRSGWPGGAIPRAAPSRAEVRERPARRRADMAVDAPASAGNQSDVPIPGKLPSGVAAEPDDMRTAARAAETTASRPESAGIWRLPSVADVVPVPTFLWRRVTGAHGLRWVSAQSLGPVPYLLFNGGLPGTV
jgi:hypothetical protein